MKKLIIVLLILSSRIANGQGPGLLSTINASDSGIFNSIDTSYPEFEVTYDTAKCIMLCSDTTTNYNTFYLLGEKPRSVPTWRHDVWWEPGYMVYTNVWEVHVSYLDKQKKPYKGFVWMAYKTK